MLRGLVIKEKKKTLNTQKCLINLTAHLLEIKCQ